MKKHTLVKKLHKPAHPLLSVIGITAAVVFFLIILAVSSRTQQPEKIKTSIFTSAPNTSQPSTQPHMYHSNFLKATFTVPNGFRVTQLYNTLTLKNDTGNISISERGTGSDTADGDINLLSERNNLILTDKKHITINKQDAIVVYISTHIDQTKEKTYFIYPAPWTVFTITTETPSLYDDLDQVAQSFRYTP